MLHAQKQGSVFHHLEKKHGLSSSSVTAVICDRDGFYWIATENGLNRFDGTNIRSFYRSMQDSNSLSHNHCTSLLEDMNGDIWIGTLYGLNCYKKKENRFIRIILRHPGFPTERLNWISGLKMDKEGNIWASTFGLWQYDINKNLLASYFPDEKSSADFSTAKINFIVYDEKQDGFWGMTSKGFIYFDRQHRKFHHRGHDPANRILFSNTEYAAFTRDSSGMIWYTDLKRNKLCRFNPFTNSLAEIPVQYNNAPRRIFMDDKNKVWIFFWGKRSMVFDPANNSIDSMILSPVHSQSPLTDVLSYLYIAPDGSYWFCSSRGISIYDKSRQNKVYLPVPRDPVTGKQVIVIELAYSETKPGLLWLNTNAGLFRTDPEGNKMLKILQPEFQKTITGLFAYGDSVLFITTSERIFRYNHILKKIEKQFAGFFPVRTSMVVDQARRIWVATWNYGMYQFDHDLRLNRHFSKKVRGGDISLKTDDIINLSRFFHDSNSFLLGYNGGNGYAEVFTLSDSIVNHTITVKDSSAKMVSNTVNCFERDDRGNLWTGTFGGGVYIKTGQGEYRNISQTDGLKTDFINSIVANRDGDMWISTTEGMNVLHKGIIINPGNEISFNSNDFRKNSFKMTDGSIFAFDSRIIMLYYPVAYSLYERKRKVLISDFRIFDRAIPLPAVGTPVSLKFRQNFFSIDFSLEKTDPEENVQYMFMLKGFNRDWVQVKNKNEISFTNVPPGYYDFLVKAANINGEWIYASSPLRIRIIPPFWNTWWFYSLAAVFVILVLWSIYRYRINHLKKMMTIRTKISQDLHDEIGSALSSIHVYSSVAARSMEKDPPKAKEALSHINENTRQVMESMSDIVWAINTGRLGETTLEVKLKNYGYELLTPLNIQCYYLIDKEAEKKLVNIEARKNLLLIAKEAMNNIAKYSGASEVTVRLEFTGKMLVLAITDNGKGIGNLDNRAGHGLNNMKQRAEALGGELLIISGQENGTSVQCEIPFTTISD
jgi:ligand-binding sensor domain-containing protein